MNELEEPRAFSTFRDPAGSVEVRRDGAYRQVRRPYDAEILAFLASPLATRLVAEGRLVASEVLVSAAGGGELLLRHPRIAFPSYPWEWPPSLWLSAADSTLRLNAELLREGWILKDATPLNVLFRGMQPVFVDLLSIQRADPEQPIWYAYGQFVRTFLLPMLAYSRMGWPLQASLLRRDGYEPWELYSTLSWWGRVRRPAFSAVTLPHLMAEMRRADVSPRFLRDPKIVRQVLLRTFERLGHQMKAATPKHSASTWSGYAETATHYSERDHAAKRAFVGRALSAGKSARVLDVGCNIGVYSSLATDAGADVVAIDTDMNTIDRFCIEFQGSGKSVLPLCVDLARPTPSAGWENRETLSFLDRCRGNFDMVLMLAVLHHVLLGSQIPLAHIAALCHAITKRDLIVEWVPPTDPKFQEVARGRDTLYQDLTETAFRNVFGRYFCLVCEARLENGRVLFHFQQP